MIEPLVGLCEHSAVAVGVVLAVAFDLAELLPHICEIRDLQAMYMFMSVRHVICRTLKA